MNRRLRIFGIYSALSLLPLLGGCALFQDHSSKTEGMQAAEAKVPAQWQAPLPHDGKVADLKHWWQQFDDPLLPELIAAAENVSPNVATARSRLYQARATSIGATASLLPSLDANLTGSRGQQDIRFPAGTATSAGLAASWEIDLFGANSAHSDASAARYSGAQADWHAARVSLAADVASSYIALRSCEARLELRRSDVKSRTSTANLTQVNADAGLESTANAALAEASAAQGNGQLTQLRSQCDIDIKALTALTAIDEATLLTRLARNTGYIPQPAGIEVDAVPAKAIAQRPDIYSAAEEVLAASADVDNLQAQRLPQISLTGSINHSRFSSDGANIEGRVWALGPLTVTLPLFDAGTRRANVEAGRAHYDEAVINYGAKLRGAVREVEEALINLRSADDRYADARTAVKGFATSYRSNVVLQRNGLASLFDLEDSRRSLIAARIALVEVQSDRINAWVSLYRALGGGWNQQDPTVIAGISDTADSTAAVGAAANTAANADANATQPQTQTPQQSAPPSASQSPPQTN